jgi:hypothetical protein
VLKIHKEKNALTRHGSASEPTKNRRWQRGKRPTSWRLRLAAPHRLALIRRKSMEMLDVLRSGR